MPELRWTLLILGALFVAALAWWELRKPRQARRGDVDLRVPSGLSRESRESREPEIETPTRVYREPTISLPDVRPRTMSASELPVIEVKDDTMLGLRIDGETIEESEREIPPIKEETILPTARESKSSRESLSDNDIDWRIDDDEHEVTWSDDEPSKVKGDVSKPVKRDSTKIRHARPQQDRNTEHAAERERGAEWSGGEPGEISAEPADGPAPLTGKLNDDSFSTSPGLSLDIPEATPPKVEWPDDAERTILALRLVAPGDRFPGRALRQALMAEGFALGKMDIFHKAGPDGRVIISAAGLTRPGTFNLDTIDTQRYTGLNLFAVLPGPLSGNETFDELLATARGMNERLRGGLQDDTGQPLTPTRIAAYRSTLVNTPAIPAANSLDPPPEDSAESDTEPAANSPDYHAPPP